MKKSSRRKGKLWLLALAFVAVAVFVAAYKLSPPRFALQYEVESVRAQDVVLQPQKPKAVHLTTPIPVKAVYMSQCLVSDKALRDKIVALINDTELNSVVIDVKDYSGRISFVSADLFWSKSVSKTCFARDMFDFVDSLHRDGIYVIGRVTVFQDPYFVSRRSDLAVTRASDQQMVWKDFKGISYLDPGAREVWDYLIALAREAHDVGFDELNFDYIRFPSDGNMSDIYFPFSEAIINADPEHGKELVLQEFFSYLNRELKKDGIIISADLFGMTTTNTDDLNIGQVLEDALSHFDYVAPMVYPSHYPSGFIGISNPAQKPYEVVKYSMEHAVRRASTTPQKLRPWLQDFNLGAVYTPDMVRAQMQAVYDSGLNSWMLWNAANRYTREALDTQ